MNIVTLNLWPTGCPNNPPASEPQPRLEIYQPARRETHARPTIIVCPGGGYAGLAPHEGDPFAALFAAHGYASAVLSYRVAPWRYPAPQADACRAIRLLRANAAQFGIDPHRIALMGFSAGGHLTATTAAQPDLHHDPHDDLVASGPELALDRAPARDRSEIGRAHV